MVLALLGLAAGTRADRRISNHKAHVQNTVRESILRIHRAGIGLFAGQNGFTSQKSHGGRGDGASVRDLRSAPAPAWPWPRIAARIRSSGSPVEPVVFESQPSGTYDAGGEFPNGFLRVPFDFYFHGSNPRLAVSGADPAEAAKSITAEVLNSGGAWLISAKGLQGATAELPRNNNVRIESVNQYSDVVVVHLLRNH